jgi:hypothetical protein
VRYHPSGGAARDEDGDQERGGPHLRSGEHEGGQCPGLAANSMLGSAA